MAELKCNGRTKVKTLKTSFKETFGVGIRIYNGARFADDDATLASIRIEKKEGELKISGNMLVGNLEKKFLEMIGIKVQIENKDGGLADDSKTLGSLSK